MFLRQSNLMVYSQRFAGCGKASEMAVNGEIAGRYVKRESHLD